MDKDLAAIEEELEALRDAPVSQPSAPQTPRRLRLPAELSRTDTHRGPALCLSPGRTDPPADAAQSRIGELLPRHWISIDQSEASMGCSVGTYGPLVSLFFFFFPSS
ncbi:hypothetical protein RQ831_19675 [Roseomonas gilardii]|uniref:Uncharacterized protein n=1 Tax=Roseomonas gilardii TaxID=257708 RepID=A0ABU3MK51_9PROT|nr:hypothetical protein [Roseomonas gilardii]MDT8333277.1 hypothetical protein [Roseomonas gilardii]